MAATEKTLLQKLQTLSSQRLALVENFIECLAGREARLTASKKLKELLSELDAVNFLQLTDEEIEAEIEAAR
jgi:hypothetical protein